MKKQLRIMIMILVMLAAMSAQAFAMDPVQVEVAFTVENAAGTVVIEGSDGAPLPEETVLTDANEGRFRMTYTEPGDYTYTIYQAVAKEDAEDGVTYDDAVYRVLVQVTVEEDDSLIAMITIGQDEDASKLDSIVFTNVLPPEPSASASPKTSASPKPTTSAKAANSPNTGDTNNLTLWFVLMAVSFAGIVSVVIASRRRASGFGRGVARRR